MSGVEVAGVQVWRSDFGGVMVWSDCVELSAPDLRMVAAALLNAADELDT